MMMMTMTMSLTKVLMFHGGDLDDGDGGDNDGNLRLCWLLLSGTTAWLPPLPCVT